MQWNLQLFAFNYKDAEYFLQRKINQYATEWQRERQSHYGEYLPHEEEE